MDRIIVIDSDKKRHKKIEKAFGNEYELTFATTGMQALRILEGEREQYVAVLLDYDLPNDEGVAVLQYMQKKGWIKTLPVIAVAGEDEVEDIEQVLRLGAADFVRKPVEPVLLKHRVRTTAELYRYKQVMEKKVQEQTAMLRKQYKVLLMQAEKLKTNNTKIIDILGTVVEYRNLENGKHIIRVKEFTRVLAEELAKEYPEYGLDQKRIERIVSASSLHDIGKITIPDSILLKPGKLTEDEFEYMKSHASRGAEILEQIQDVWDKDYGQLCYDICRHHHERYDGRGYPDHLKGEDIPIAAQIVSVADVYDALVSERVYKKAVAPERAFHMIISGECGLFSPKLLVCLRSVRPQMEQIAKELVGTEE